MQAFKGKIILTLAAGLAALSLTSLPARAQTAQEVTTLGTHIITITLHPFLSDEDLTVLRFIASAPEALALFITSNDGHAAIAVSPDEGFVKDGAPTAGVGALGGLPDAETAARDAVAACQKSATTPTPCQVILQISPK